MVWVLAAAAPSFVEQFWPILAAGSFGVGGALLGKAFERRHGYEAWRRDHRLAAYSEVLERSHAFWAIAARMYQRPEEQDDLLDELNDRKLAFHRSLARVELLGPEDVYEAGKRLGDVIAEIGDLVTTSSSVDNSVPLSETDLGRTLAEADTAYVRRGQAGLGTDGGRSSGATTPSAAGYRDPP